MSTSTNTNKDGSHKVRINNQIMITDIIIVLIKNLKVLILLPFVSVFITSIYVTFLVKPIYTSTSKIMSSTSSGGMSQAMGLASQFGLNLSNTQNQPRWVYAEIIKSRTIARSMLKRKFDTKKYGKQKTLLQILSHGNEDPQFGKDTLKHIAIDKFLEMIDINEDEKTGILTLSLNSEEPKFSALLNKMLIEELDLHQRTYNKDITTSTKKFIGERIVDTEKELVEAEEALKVFRDRNRRIENSPALQLQQQRLVREVTVLTGVFTTLKQQLETAKIEEVKESDYVIIIDSPTEPIVRSKPNKKLMVVSSFVLGLLLGVILSFINNYFMDSNPKEKEERRKIRLLFLNKVTELIPKSIIKKYVK